MPIHTEYKFVTTRLKGFAPGPNDPGYFNWSDVSEMLSRYGMEGWKVTQASGTKLGEDTVLYSFVLERPVSVTAARRTR